MEMVMVIMVKIEDAADLFIRSPARHGLHDLVIEEDEEVLDAAADEALEGAEAAEGDGHLVWLVILVTS